MTLLQEVQAAAVDDKVPISTLLRKCSVLATRLDHFELKAWVDRELNGYANLEEVPTYRVLPAPATGNLAGPFGSGWQNVVIPPAVLPEWGKRFAEEVRFTQPIAAIASLASSKDLITSPWPGNLLLYMQGEGNKFTDGLVLYGAWQTVSKAGVAGIIDAVRNRVLEFALQLEKASPEAGEPGKPESAVPAATVTHLYQTIINGNVTGNIATGSPGALQTTHVAKGDLSGLVAALRELGVPQETADELVPVLQEEVNQPMGPKTAGWISSISTKVAKGGIKLAENATTAAIVKLVMSYFGF